nr:MAG TPA: hypothetical protein [Caudoviricetes sp.]
MIFIRLLVKNDYIYNVKLLELWEIHIKRL